MDALRKNQLYTAELTGYTAEGLGVARVEGQVVFVHGGVRGEVCRIRVMKVLKHLAYARVEEVLTPSPARVEPDCPHYPACGGCDFRHITYAEELEAKRRRVEDALRRVGGAEVSVTEILGSEAVDGCRNKCQFPVSRQGLAGFYRARSHEVIPAADCRAQAPQARAAARAVEGYLAEYHVPAYDETTGEGLLRHIYVRTSRAGRALVCLVVNGGALPHEAELVKRLREACPDCVGVVLSENTRATNVVLGDCYRTLWGEDALEDTLCGHTFRLAIPAFYQVNVPQAERLYAKAAELAGLTGAETVLELYCGAGTITLTLAERAKRVIGAEIVPEAVENARENARRNGVDNAEFFCGDAADVAEKLASEGLRPNVVVVDPPRKGLEEPVIASVAAMAPDRVVYVSCDCATLARDVKRFASLGYRLERAVAVDMFPRTRHVETVVLLSRETNPLTVEVRMEVETGEVKEHPTYKRIQEYVQEKYGFKVHTAYIAEVKRMVGLDMHKAPNAVEQRKHEYHPCPPEKVEAIKDALRHFGLIAE